MAMHDLGHDFDGRESREERRHADELLDKALKDSMDASDPPGQTQPGDEGEPAESSGYDADKEAALRKRREKREG